MVNKEARDTLLEMLIGYSAYFNALMVSVASIEDGDEHEEVVEAFVEIDKGFQQILKFVKEESLFE